MVKNFLIAYGFTPPLSEERIQQMARFNLVDTGFAIGVDIAKIKAISPQTKIIGYMNAQMVQPNYPWYPEVTVHEDWFLHDLNGDRLVNKIYLGEYLNESNSDWQTYYANKVLTHCAQFGFDGVFVDDVNEFGEWHRNNRFTVPGSLVPDIVITGSYNRMMSFVQNVRAKLSGKLMIVNPNNLDFADYADGYLIESYMDNPTYQQQHFEWLFAKPNKTKICHSKTAGPDFSFATALLGDNVIWGYAIANWFPGDPNQGYYPQMDIDTGNPRSPVYVQDNIHIRRYDHVIVAVNLDETVHSTIIEETAYTLDSRSAVIIPWEAPPTPILATVSLAGIGGGIGYALNPEEPVVPMIVGAAAGGIIGFIIDRTLGS